MSQSIFNKPPFYERLTLCVCLRVLISCHTKVIFRYISYSKFLPKIVLPCILFESGFPSHPTESGFLLLPVHLLFFALKHTFFILNSSKLLTDGRPIGEAKNPYTIFISNAEGTIETSLYFYQYSYLEDTTKNRIV